MMEVPVLQGEKIYLRRLKVDDVSEDYVNWMNDPEINQYLESKFYTHTIDSTKDFVNSVFNDNNILFGIFLKGNGKHIGNIKIGNINYYHKNADVGFLVGNKGYWGRGIASEAIRLATNYAFKELKLHKLWGGLYSVNIGSKRAFEKAGYQLEGVLRKHDFIGGDYCDDYIYGILNERE